MVFSPTDIKLIFSFFAVFFLVPVVRFPKKAALETIPNSGSGGVRIKAWKGDIKALLVSIFPFNSIVSFEFLFVFLIFPFTPLLLFHFAFSLSGLPLPYHSFYQPFTFPYPFIILFCSSFLLLQFFLFTSHAHCFHTQIYMAHKCHVVSKPNILRLIPPTTQ